MTDGVAPTTLPAPLAEATAEAGPTADGPDVAALNSAPMATLTRTCASDRAHALVDHILSLIIAHEERAGIRLRKRRATDLAGLKRTAGALLADLLARPPQNGQGGFVYRSLNANSFSETSTPYRPFMAALKALSALDLVERTEGFYDPRKFDWGNGTYSGQGKASRFRATPKLLTLSTSHGLKAGAVRDHFRQPLPTNVVILKGKTTRVGRRRIAGQHLDVPDNRIVRTLSDQVRSINTFLRDVTITGGDHDGFFRAFEHGDQPDFEWNKGGRLYSSGRDNYQALNHAVRLEMRLNGRAVVEIDLKASYLTILHGKLGVTPDFGRDPYFVPGLPRSVVKSWFVAAFGAEKHLQRWPVEAAKEYEKLDGGLLGRDYPIKVVRERLLAKYPVLEHIGEPGFGWADMMFAESQAIIGTMLKLMQSGIPSLPIHDSLLIPAHAEGHAVHTLAETFKAVVGLGPLIKVERGASQ